MAPSPPRSRLPRLLALALLAAALVLAALYGPGWLDAIRSGSTPAPTEPAGLSLDLTDGAVVTDPELTLTGAAAPNQQVLVNGQPVPIGPDGAFELTLRLAEGPNLIVVEAVDAGGNRISLTRQVIYSLTGEAPPAAPATDPLLPAGLLILAVVVLLAAILIIVLRRRRPWVNLTTSVPELQPGLKGEGPTVTIILELDRTTRLSMYILNAGGSRITTLLNNRSRKAGRHTFTWDAYVAGELVSAGRYTVRVEAGGPLFKTVAKTDIQVRPNLRL